MKNISPAGINGSVNHRNEGSASKTDGYGIKNLSGSVTNKYPVVLDGGRTIIFVSDQSKATEAKANYELRMANRFVKYIKKPRT